MRRILVFTGNRADHGPLVPLLRALHDSPAVQVELLVAAAHLTPSHRASMLEITRGDTRIAGRVEMVLDGDSASAVTKSLALGLLGCTEVIDRTAPDLVVVLGDRYEALAVALACLLADVPVAHVGGGETTSGVVDDTIRHVITKMSHLHFVAAEPFRRRLLRMGEHPGRVWTVGALSLDDLDEPPLLDRRALERALGLRLRRPTILLTYHPVVRGAVPPGDAVREVLNGVAAHRTATIIATEPNVDVGRAAVVEVLQAFAAAHPDTVHIVHTLGRARYLSALRHADVVVGNSSSGMLEAPALGTPSVDVGTRQHGRLRAPSVIHCREDAEAVTAAIATALSPEFRGRAAGGTSPYGAGGAAERVASVLSTVPLDGLLAKPFHDAVTPTGVG